MMDKHDKKTNSSIQQQTNLLVTEHNIDAGLSDMSVVTREQVLEQLRQVTGPDFDGDIVSQGLVSDIFIAGSKVFFSITVPADRAQALEPMRAMAEKLVKA